MPYIFAEKNKCNFFVHMQKKTRILYGMLKIGGKGYETRKNL